MGLLRTRAMEKIENARKKVCAPLLRAMELNNEFESEFAWVYDRYKDFKGGALALTTFEAVKEFEEFMDKIPPEDASLDANKFILVPVDNFDNMEQVHHLIVQGKFYYAPTMKLKFK
jgi:hypothetical protein